MNRLNAWKKVGWGALLVAAIAAPEAFHAVRAAPQPLPAAFSAAPAAAKPFAGVCKANEVADSRPDPAWVGASLTDNCWAPPMPKVLDGATAKREQIVTAMAAVKRYAALSDAYQRCISNFVAARKAEAAQKPADGPLMVIEAHRIFVSQVNKAKAETQVKVAINAFNEYGSECPGQ